MAGTKLSIVAITTALFLQTVTVSMATECGKEDWFYSYTECDASGSRWRVAVPKSTKGEPCVILKPPVRGKACTFSCEPGTYLAVQGDQECKKCEPGTYSLGGGLRLDDWTEIPTQLVVHTEPLDLGYGDLMGDTGNCSNSWIAGGAVLVGMPGNCASAITLTVNLVKPGIVEYEYQYPDSNVMLQFKAQNDLCQSDEDTDSTSWPSTTGNEFKKQTVHLKKGLNTLRWKMISFNIDRKQRFQPIYIKRIEVTGIAFSSSCSPCPAGTVSYAGAKECKPCPRNSYSARQSATCQACGPNMYSEPGSSKCEDKPPCAVKDYFALNTPCNDKNLTKKMYQWIAPKVCRDDLKGSKKLPASGNLEPCPPCNPGMEYSDNSTDCKFCPKNHFSNGRDRCQKCPANTAPANGYKFLWWNRIPPPINVACLSMDETGCASSEGWQVAGDHIHTGLGHQDDVYLVMTLDVPGFQAPVNPVPGGELGRISFVFELDCDGDCSFYFMRDLKVKETNILQTWTGDTQRQSYTYAITDSSPVTFSWAFQKTSWTERESSSSTRFGGDVARIFSINITNTLDGGASECVPCPRGSKGSRCIPCPAGHFIEPNTTTCQSCPAGTVADGELGVGLNSCVKCGPGLTSHKGLHCYAPCRYVHPKTRRTYDLSSLSGSHVVEGSRLFTASGTQYYHNFNFTVCGNPDNRVVCSNNVKVTDTTHGATVDAFVCRSTIIPSSKHHNGLPGLYAQAVSLGDEIIAFTDAHSFDGLNMTKEFDSATDAPGADAPDLHFYFRSTAPTSACPEGRSTIVTLRCDADDKQVKGELSLPSKCADGTCDGCNFDILWRTGAACPICADEDFTKIKGECVDSQQKIHYLPPKTCRVLEERKIYEVVPCTVVLPIILQFAIAVGVAVAALLAVLVYYYWYKNRTLEYKYMKLVAGASGAPKMNQDGEMELPMADSCAVDSDEEDDEFDSVDFKEGSRKKNLLNKLRTMGGGGGSGGSGGGGLSSPKQSYGSDLETNLLNEKSFHEL